MRKRGSKNNNSFSRCRYVEQPERNLFLQVLKLWILDIKKKSTEAYIDWLDREDFLLVIELAGLSEESVGKMIRYIADRPYKPREFDAAFRRLVEYSYDDKSADWLDTL